MKREFWALFVFAFCLCCTLISCKKDNHNPVGDGTMSVSLVSDKKYDRNGKASLTVLLSSPATKPITVTLTDGKSASGFDGLMPAKYIKKVTIPQGKLGARQTITVTPGSLESGTYQTVIQIASVSGGAVVDKSSREIRLNYDYNFLPVLSYDSPVNPFGSKSGRTKLTFRLSERAADNVTFTLERDASSTIGSLAFNSKVTIPAGSETVDVELSTDPNVPFGLYTAVINIKEVQNAKAPSRPTVTIDFLRSDDAGIEIDGKYDDWALAEGVKTLVCPDNVFGKYVGLKQVKAIADSRYIYFYIICDGGQISMPFDFFIDEDGDPATGGFATTPEQYGDKVVQNLWSNMGCEWLLEQEGLYNTALEKVFDFTSNPLSGWDYNHVLHYEGENGGNMYSDESNHLIRKYEGDITQKMFYAQGQVAPSTYSGEVVPDGCVFECRFSRRALNMTGNKCRFGMKYMRGAGWPMFGMLPQGAYSGGNRQLVDMYELSLPQFVDAY